MKLYEISEKFLTLYDMAQNEDIEPEMIQDCLESMEAELEDKAEDLVKIMKSLEGDIDILKKESDRLDSKRKTLENKKEWLKKYLESNMISIGRDKINTSLFSIHIQNNPPSVDILDEAILSSRYLVPQPSKIDKRMILEDLKNGESVNGCILKQSKSIRIK